MKQFSQSQLDSKIQGFMSRKMSKFPELQDERYYIERSEPAKRSRVSRQFVFPSMKLGSQY